MADTNVYDVIQRSALAVARGVDFDGIGSTDIKLRHLPKASETLDTLPCLVLAFPDEPEEDKPLSFEAEVGREVIYPVDMVFIAAGNSDFEGQRARYTRWREQLRRAFQGPRLDGAATVFMTQIRPWVPLDRGLLNQQYAYSGITVRFHSAERRGN